MAFFLKLTQDTIDLPLEVADPQGEKNLLKICFKRYEDDERMEIFKELMGDGVVESSEEVKTLAARLDEDKNYYEKVKLAILDALVSFKDIKQYDANYKLVGTEKDTRDKTITEDGETIDLTNYIFNQMWKYSFYKKALTTLFISYIADSVADSGKLKN